MAGSVGAMLGTAAGSGRDYQPGLSQRFYSGYAGTDTSFFDSRSPFSTAIDLAPASASLTGSAATSVLWLGYYRAPSTGNFTLTLAELTRECFFYMYLWLGPLAKTGYDETNATVTFVGSASVPLQAGVYYPLRVQLAYDGDNSSSFISFTVRVNGSTSYPIFYNANTGGF